MQELIETMMEEWGEGRGLPEWAETALEKEKEHIMMAFNDGKINSVLKKRDSKEYYNQTYN